MNYILQTKSKINVGEFELICFELAEHNKVLINYVLDMNIIDVAKQYSFIKYNQGREAVIQQFIEEAR